MDELKLEVVFEKTFFLILLIAGAAGLRVLIECAATVFWQRVLIAVFSGACLIASGRLRETASKKEAELEFLEQAQRIITPQPGVWQYTTEKGFEKIGDVEESNQDDEAPDQELSNDVPGKSGRDSKEV